MSRPVEEINLDDLDYDEDYEDYEYEDTVGGGRIQTPARRGSIEWEGNDITEEDKDNIEDLTRRFEELRRGRAPNVNIAELTEELRYSELIDINTKLSTFWKDYVEKLGNKFKIDGGDTFKRGTVWSMTDDGVFVEYKGKKTRLTVAGNPRKFLKPITIASYYGRGGTSFVRDILGVVDYSSSRKKTQQQAETASISARNVPKLGETPTGRPKNARRVLESLQQTNQDMEGLGLDLANDPIADHEEISTFLTEQGQLKKLADVYKHLVRRRDEKEAELKNLKSKGDRTVSFVNPAYEGEEGEALLPVSEEDAERARELEAEIKEFDIAIAEQDAKVRNSLQRLRRSIENFIDSDDTLGSRVRTLFRQEGVTIASIVDSYWNDNCCCCRRYCASD